nr:MAG TPA: hypothetical protein [Bacteriophage sp.]
MIDSVLKGTGNSRFLKSAVPAGTSWADALAMLQAGTFPIDFNGINTEGFQQVGTPLNKANLLKDATAAQIGLPPSTTPDGMFQALGNTGELHVWRKTVVTKDPVPEVPGSYTLGSAAITNLARMTSNGYNGYAANILVSKEIKVNLDGSVELVSPTSRQMTVAGSSERYTIDVNSDELLGAGNRYFTPSEDSESNSSRCTLLIPPGTVYYVAPGTTYTTAMRSIGFTSAFNAAQLVTGVPGTPAIPAGTTTTYPVSTNPKAYQEGDDAKAAGYTLGEVVSGNFRFATNSNHSVWYHVSDSLNVADNGAISLGAYERTSMRGGTDYSAIAGLKGKFIQLESNDYAGYVSSPFSNLGIYYVPSDAVFSDGPSTDRYQPVTGYAAIPAGTTIEYLGKLGDKARVQVLSYVGTGTYGESNPCSLTFDFVPKIVLLLGKGYNSYVGLLYFVPTIKLWNCIEHQSIMPTSVTLSGKTMSWWYQYNTVGYQANISGEKYIAIAIG